MKVLVADKFEQSGLDGLNELGVEVQYSPDLADESLGQAIRESQANVLIVRSTKVSEAMMDGSKLELIIRAGAGYNTIDVAAASSRGILVTNCPGKNSHAVAELAFGLILALDRHIPDNVAELRGGKWNKKKFSKAKGLYGRTLGLVGMGTIGKEMIPRAKAFGMNVAVYSRWMTPEIASDLGVYRAGSLEELAGMSDVVSVHVSLTPETKNSLGDKFFAAMKKGAYFVNTSRGEVVDQVSLIKAIEEKGILAGLDVFADEPSGGEADYQGALKDNPNVYCTHHIGASTDQAQEAVAAETVRIVREYQQTGAVPNVVNIKRAELATHMLVVRHLDKVGVLAQVMGVLKDEGVSVQEMENVVLSGAKSAIAQIALDKELSPDGLIKVRQNESVFGASLLPMGK